MGKLSKKSAVKVEPAAVSAIDGKSGKRNAEDDIEKAAKKRKTAPQLMPVKNDLSRVKKQPPPKKAESSSSDEDSSESEEEVMVQPKKAAQSAKQESSSDSSDDSSSDEEPAKKPAASSKRPVELAESDSSSSDSNSDEDDEVMAQPKTAAQSAKQESSSDSSEDSSSDEEPAKPAAASKNVESDSSSSDSSSDEDDEDMRIKAPAVAKRMEESSESSDSESSDSEDEKPATRVKNSSVAAVQKKNKDSDSSESDSDDSSDEDMPTKEPVAERMEESSDSADSEADSVDEDTKAVIAKKNEESSNSSDTDSDSDEDTTAKIVGSSKAVVSEKKEESSGSSDSDSDSDSDVPAKSSIPAKRPLATEKNNGHSKDDSDDSSGESDEEPPQKKLKVLIFWCLLLLLKILFVLHFLFSLQDSSGTAKPASKVAKKESSGDDDSSEESSGSDEENDQSVSVKKSAQNEPKTPASSSQATTVSKTVFVGNLSYNVDKEQVKQFFQEAGEIIDIRVAAFEDGSSKGFAHVEFATTEAAQKACELNGHDLMGRPVRLNFAQERGAFTPGSGRDNNSFKKPGQSSNSTAFIRGFDSSLGEDQIRSSLQKHFSSCGEITRVSIPKDYETGASKGIAYMVFSDNSSLSKAMELSGSDLGGFSLFVDEAKPKPGNRDGAVSSSRGRSGRARSDERGGRSGSMRGRSDGRGRGRSFGRGDRGRSDRGRGRSGAPQRQSALTASTGLPYICSFRQGRRSPLVMTDLDALKHQPPVTGLLLLLPSLCCLTEMAGFLGKVVDAAIGWMVESILGSFFTGQMEAWTREVGLAEDVEKLKFEMRNVEMVLAAAEGRRIDNKPLARSLDDLKELIYDSEDVMDELDYYRLQQEIEQGNGSSLPSGSNPEGSHASSSTPSSAFEFVYNGTNQITSWASRDRKRKRGDEGPAHSTLLTFEVKHDISKRINRIVNHLCTIGDSVQRVLQLATAHPIATSSQSQNIARNARMTTSVPIESKVYGRDAERDRIIDLLINRGSNDLNVLPVVGIGGVGKTTLARYVYSDERVSDHFDLQMWVCVSTDFSERRLTLEILEHVCKDRQEYENISNFNVLQKILLKYIRNKRFILVLDDVWEDRDRSGWDELLAPLRCSQVTGCMILATTRRKSVAKLLGTMTEVELNGLDEKEFWLLFKAFAFGNENYEGHSSLQSIGKQIAKALKGCPLAAQSVGALLNTSISYKHWRTVHDKWKSLQEDADDILPILKISYDYLPVHLQRCFSFCSLFPEDYQFNGEKLVHAWISQNFVQCEDPTMRLEETGQQYLDRLVDLGFFQKVGSHYVMHDLMHELAGKVSSNECATIHGLKPEATRPSVRHLSIITTAFDKDVRGSFPNEMFDKVIQKVRSLHKLRTLMLFGKSTEKFLESLLTLCKEAKCLRFLSVTGADIISINNFLSSCHLRYVSVYGSHLKQFPQSLTRCYHLQVLDVGILGKFDVPTGMNNLVYLRHLIAHEKVHHTIACVGNMTSLQELKFKVQNVGSFGIGQLKAMSELVLLGISQLENVSTEEEARGPGL
ncbi:hypothetical protein ACQ4PT_038838 [Festuca glaucescens]